MKHVQTDKLTALNDQMEGVKGGLSDGSVIMRNVDADKCTLSQMTSLYTSKKKEGKITVEFEKKLKTTLDVVRKDFLVSLCAGSNMGGCYSNFSDAPCVHIRSRQLP